MSYFVIFLQTLIFGYAIVTTFIPLGRFTGVKNTPFAGRLRETLFNGVVFALPVILTYNHYREGVYVYALIVLGEYLSWWHPYFFGPSAHWRVHYDRYFANTILAPLPRIRHNPVPNLEHFILHSGTLVVLILTWRLFF